MRQIYCADKECELLPSTQTGGSIQCDNINTAATGGLIPEATSSSVPFSSVRKTRKRRTQRGGGGRRRNNKPTKRLRKVQVGGGGRRKKKKTKKTTKRRGRK